MAWSSAQVTSPHLSNPVPVIVARDVPYTSNANRFQNVNIYLLRTPDTETLVGSHVTSLPSLTKSVSDGRHPPPQWHVHIHGGAWRDPQLTSASIEAAVTHAFSGKKSIGGNDDDDGATVFPITAIVSINYTLAPFPTHPTLPYDPVKDNHRDPSREAVHPMHVHDVLRAFGLLRSLGLTDGSYILTGHSAGACLAFQATLHAPQHWNFTGNGDASSPSPLAPPRPAAMIGMNGLYDLPDLVHNLGPTHAHLGAVYANLQSIAFGSDESTWPDASPARANVDQVAQRVEEGHVPRLIVLDQSVEDQLVPVNQADTMEALLRRVSTIRVVRGHRCTGVHAAPWEQGYMIWEGVQDVLTLLS